MVDLKFDERALMVGKEKAALLSGAVHYWRLSPGRWEAILRTISEMGLKMVETYIPWQFHELRRGQFDFAGETDSQRNLVGFLTLAKELGFWVILRPGPFIYSEWVNMGIPTDVAKYHRIHPEFVARAREYIRAVSNVIRPFLATRGGNVVMVQVDNEADLFENLYEDQLGLGHEPGLFQQYLQDKYVDLAKLNEVWRSDYEDFKQARAIQAETDLGREYTARYRDFTAFRFWYVKECVRIFAEEYRKNGIDVPLLHNTYDTLEVQDFRELEGLIDVVGLDTYPPNEFQWHIAHRGHGVPMDRNLWQIFRYLRTYSRLPYIAEFESGNAHGQHYYTGVFLPNHYSLTALMAIASGIVGWNWYMLVNRDNWYMSPINEWGRKQGELFTVFSEIVSVFHKIDVPSLDRVTHTSVSFCLEHHLSGSMVDDSVLKAIYEAGIDYEFFNLRTGEIRKDLLLYSGPSWLPVDDQQRLCEYVEGGGHLVFFQHFPVHDENGEAANILGLAGPDRVLSGPFLTHLAGELEIDLGGRLCRSKDPVYVFDGKVPGEPIYATRVDTDVYDTGFEENADLRRLMMGRKYRIGYSEKRGRGSITVIAAVPSSELLVNIHHFLGVRIPAMALWPNVTATLLKGKRGTFVVVLNMGNENAHAEIAIDPESLPAARSSVRILTSAGELTFNSIERGRLGVKVPRKNGLVIAVE